MAPLLKTNETFQLFHTGSDIIGTLSKWREDNNLFFVYFKFQSQIQTFQKLLYLTNMSSQMSSPLFLRVSIDISAHKQIVEGINRSKPRLNT